MELDIIESIKEFIEITGIQQQEAAKELGVNPDQLNRWLRGRVEPTRSSVFVLTFRLKRLRKKYRKMLDMRQAT